MKGIQVSIDVSESEIVPKAFQRPAVSGVRAECVFCGRQAKKISSHRHDGGWTGGGGQIKNVSKMLLVFQADEGDEDDH